ncbi:MAG: hypothetical protein KJO21_03080 [Verrucomicrobiae bacterium]|nr:hypothetical protein [Verrucomicrobiae bacterium]NNJ41900.1 hypothetical protein [Akkermansiaceae bacterium]
MAQEKLHLNHEHNAFDVEELGRGPCKGYPLEAIDDKYQGGGKRKQAHTQQVRAT